MNTFLLIVMVSKTFAHYLPETDSPNVGTVLFGRSDLNKRNWSKTNLALLQTRKYFQNLIPSPKLINTMNEEYLTSLLKYFENSYFTIKREIKNPPLSNMMNIALSDALGGYLKVWVLPITKYAYYGGTVPLQKCLRIFQAYEDIKRSLKTDGSGWRNPNENLLNAVAINIASLPRIAPTRSMGDPCKHIAYYEKTDSGMTIPLPFINWNIYPNTMFLPLKNESIVSLSCPNSSLTLLKYYDIAENCMQSQKPRLNDFDQRFQKWLSTEIAPHLNDDKLYVAFGSILSLMNVTKRFCEKISNTYSSQINNLKYKALCFRKPMQLSSKKFIVIALILFIEVIWCIPTLILIMRSKNRKRKSKKYFGGLLKRKHSSYSLSESQDKIPKTIDKGNESIRSHGVKLFLKPRARNLEVDVQFPSYDSRYMISTKTSNTYPKSDISSEQKTLVNEVSLNPSLKMVLPECNTTSETLIDSSKNTTDKQGYTKVAIKRDVRKIKEIMSSKTLTLIKNSERTIKDITYSQEKPSLLDNEMYMSSCKCCISPENYVNEKEDTSHRCPCTNCLRVNQIEHNKILKNITYTESQPPEFKHNEGNKKGFCKTVMFSQLEMSSEKRLHTQKPKKTSVKSNKSNIKKDSEVKSNQPLFRIKIERPQAAIKVGITSYKDRPDTKNKPSRIPRPAAKMQIDNKTIQKVTDAASSNTKKDNTEIIPKKGLIIKGRAIDDCGIKRLMADKHSGLDKKLNLSL